jgi:oligopeptide transport system substrate-binding protein
MNSSRRPSARTWLSFVLIALALAIHFTGGAARAQGPKADLSYIDRGDIGTLDPNRASWMQDIRVCSALWEGLYMNSATTFEPELAAAEKVEVSDDKTVWSFHLRANARWSNGDPLTSADFIFAWKRMLEEPGDYTYLIDSYVKGAKEYENAFGEYIAKRASGAQATPPDFKTVGMEAPDSATLRVTLKHPVSFFPDLCAFPCYFPLNERAMQPFREVDP